MIDYHLHGNFSGHGKGDLEEYVLSAIEKGFEEIGFSDHLPKLKEPDPYHAMPLYRLPEYVRTVRRLQKKYEGSIIIKLGIEADYFEGYELETAYLLKAYPFDYVLGSIHFLEDWHFTSREGWERYRTEDPDSAFSRYFFLVEKMINTGLFDILAHPDAIGKEDFFPSYPLNKYYDRVGSLLAEKGMSIEINTAGLRRRAGAVYPKADFLKSCVARGVSLTTGSDAHQPDEVGRDFESARELLESVNGCEIATYSLRNRTRTPFGEILSMKSARGGSG